MKKLILLFAALAVLLSLAACAPAPVDVPADTAEPADTPAETEPDNADEPDVSEPDASEPDADTDEPDASEPDAAVGEPDDADGESEAAECIIIEYDVDAQEYAADDGTVIMTTSYSTPSVQIPANEAASAAIAAEFVRLKEEFGAAYPDMLAEAEAMHADGFLGDMQFYAACKFTVSRADAAVVSLLELSEYFMAGAHGSAFLIGRSFDASTGGVLTLSSLTGDYEAFVEFANEYVLTLAAEHEYAEGYFDGYEEYIGAVVSDDTFYFTPTGMTFVCNNYVFGPYAMGSIEFEIPYADLAGHIDEKWLPAGYDVFAPVGMLSCDYAENIGVFEDSTVAELIIDAEGPMLAVWADGPITDVSVRTIQSSDGLEYWFDDELLYLSEMDDGDVFWFKADIPDAMPRHSFSWTQADGTRVTRLLSCSGMDGSIMLLDW